MIRHIVKVKKNQYEKAVWKHRKLVVGIDEVGRGCLAGPVVTGAVILPVNGAHRLLKDSKLLSPEERQKAYSWIISHCYYQVGIIHHRLIDSHNIYQATMLGMKKALVNLMAQCHKPIGAIVIDAMPLKIADTGIQNIPVYHFPKGETKSSSIAAGSIVAKVTRDRLMELYEPLFPGYKLAQHKGYATPIHQMAIKELSETIIHRRSFIGAFLDRKEEDEHNQQTFF